MKLQCVDHPGAHSDLGSVRRVKGGRLEGASWMVLGLPFRLVGGLGCGGGFGISEVPLSQSCPFWEV